ncbi:glycosyltransferase family 87 protein [Amycolatopsis panacis]|uniref:glycosyltransferase family 87 protein n=1 Tax=Amycolatopsis panacis TaxID=2340917 RepID=UPI0013141B93|nr:glycosyltransferase family 87 protein [Amycolatopsis panacis]
MSGAIGLVLLGLLDLAYRSRFGDLQSFYQATLAWLHGLDPYGQLPVTYAGPTPGFIYPPFALLPLSVLAALPFPAAAVLSVLVSLSCLGFTVFLVLRRVWPDGGTRGCLNVTIAVLPILLLLEPVRNTVGQGQINLLLMALVAADFLVENPRWPRGMLIGIAAAIKITPAAFVLFFLVRKDFRSSLTAAGTAAAVTGGMALLMPEESKRFFFGGVLNGPAGIVNRDNQTISAALNRLGLHGVWHHSAWIVLAALVLVAAVLIMRRSSTEIGMLAGAAAALLLSPLSWTAHWVWVAPALVALAAGVLPSHGFRPLRTADRRIRLLLTCSALLLLGPQILTPAEGPWVGWQLIVANTYPLVTVAVLLTAAYRTHRAAVLTPIRPTPARPEPIAESRRSEGRRPSGTGHTTTPICNAPYGTRPPLWAVAVEGATALTGSRQC